METKQDYADFVASSLHARQIISGRDTERVARSIRIQWEKLMRAEREGHAKVADQLDERLKNYFGNGGLFNPEMMEHDKVRDLMRDLHDFVRRFASPNIDSAT